MRIAATGSVSKIYKRLVIEDKQAANAGGWYSDSGLDSGRLGFYAIAAENVGAEALDKAISAVIEEFKREGVTQAELDRARASYIAEFVYTSDSQSRMARHYGWRLATGMSVADVEAWPDRLNASHRRRRPRGRAQISCRQEFRHRLSAARARIHQQHW